MNQKPRAYLFVGGGTGGHLYPALAIAEQIQSNDPHALVRFVCSDRAIDTEILSAANVEFTPINAKPMVRSIGGFVAFVKGWRSSAMRTQAVLEEMLPTHDVVVVAMGGFVAPIPVLTARRVGVPVALVNLDAVPGKANRLIAHFADRICTALPVATKNWETLGPIVRRSAKGTPHTGHETFGLDPSKHTLLITGGSQGAKSINGFIQAMVGHYPDAFAQWQVIHQTGPDADAQLAALYAHAGIHAWVGCSIDQMGDAWGCADLTLGRCGAGTIAESWAAGVPGVFLPYPYHKDQHQKHNAQVLVDVGAAVVCEDQIDPESNIKLHGKHFASILSEPTRLESMRARFADLGNAEGAQAAAELLMGLDR